MVVFFKISNVLEGNFLKKRHTYIYFQKLNKVEFTPAKARKNKNYLTCLVSCGRNYTMGDKVNI
jgi:hypothetical protein